MVLENKSAMRIRMIADGVAGPCDPANGIRIELHVSSHKEERRLDQSVVQNREYALGVGRVGPVIECQGNDPLLCLDPAYYPTEALKRTQLAEPINCQYQ